MTELFEFVISKKNDEISDRYIEQFIKNYLDKNSLYWGGGYDNYAIKGVISSDKRSVDITSLINNLINYFDESTKIKIEVFNTWYKEINFSNLIKRKNFQINRI